MQTIILLNPTENAGWRIVKSNLIAIASFQIIEAKTDRELVEISGNFTSAICILMNSYFHRPEAQHPTTDIFTNTHIKFLLLLENNVLSDFTFLIKYSLNACMLLNARPEEFSFAIQQLQEGKKYICSEISYKLLSEFFQHNIVPPQIETVDMSLGKRENEILKLIAEGLTNDEIANIICASRRTVEMYRNTLIRKTNTKNTASLIKFAYVHKLLK